MAFATLSDSLIQVGKALKREIFTNLKGNDDDLDSRVSTLEGGANKIVVFNKIIHRTGAVGDLMWSYLTEAEFQTRYGYDWILANGTSIAGSDLAALRTWGAIPDSRGRFLRMRDDTGAVDLGGTRELGHNQAGDNLAHTHTVPYYIGEASGSNLKIAASYNDTNNTNATSASSGTESRPVNTCANLYARLYDGSFNAVEIWRSPLLFNLISAKVTNLTAGTAGTLEINVRKGTALDGLNTVFSTLPSVGYAAGNGASSSNAVFSDVTVGSADWLVLDIASLQTNQINFHMYLVGELG